MGEYCCKNRIFTLYVDINQNSFNCTLHSCMSVSVETFFLTKCSGCLVRTLKVHDGCAILGPKIIVFLTSVSFYFIKNTKTAVDLVFFFFLGKEAIIHYLVCFRAVIDFGNAINI